MTTPRIKESATVLLVRDVEAAANHYRDALGFRYEQLWGDPPAFCILWRDDHSVMLSLAADPSHIVPHYTVSDELWNIYFWVDDADAMYEELVARGAVIDYPPSDKPYGCREFAVRDLDGYSIAFGQEL